MFIAINKVSGNSQSFFNFFEQVAFSKKRRLKKDKLNLVQFVFI